MTTATIQALTEAEVRQVIQERLEAFPGHDPRSILQEAVEDIADVLVGPAYEALESSDPRDPDAPKSRERHIWADLRPSEAVILRRHGQDAVDRAFRGALQVIIDEVVRAALAAASEIPEAPRAPRAAAA